MKVLVVGGGGREHAIVWALSKSPKVKELYCAPGNGGIASLATCVPIKATDVDAMVDWCAAHEMDFVVVDNIDTVINVNLPEDNKEYIHRCGRCGRNEKKLCKYHDT